MKISIIIPVYNVAPYVRKCIESLINQDLSSKDYEVIVVNDGSTDESLSIVNSLDWQDVNHTITTQENGGLSAARNKGLELATGEYVWFIDSDDWIEENSLKDISNYLQGQDILALPFYYVNRESQQELVGFQSSEHTGADFSKHSYSHCVPFYIYKLAFFNKIGFRFQSGIYHEDTLFTPRALYLADYVKTYDKPVYHYYMRNNSITSGINPKRIRDLMFIIDTHIRFLQTIVKPMDVPDWSNGALGASINGMLYQTMVCEDDLVKRDVISFCRECKSLAKLCTFSHNLNTRIMGYISSLFNINIYTVYKILYKVRY